MQQRISPVKSISGSVRLPGDKSISHRYAMLCSIAEGPSTIDNYSTGADCQSTLGCMRALGVPIRKEGSKVSIDGVGLRGLKAAGSTLDAGNSGSTIRMLSGILAGQSFDSRIQGDDSLARRPMARIIKPLTQMGAEIVARDGQYPPLEIHGHALKAIDYALPVASAQVKTCVLFAGMYAEGETIVREPVRTRDHSEIALRALGADLDLEGNAIRLQGSPKLRGHDLTVPGDLSSAAFFLVAALIVREAKLAIQGVGLNPTRSELLDFLTSMGAKVEVDSVRESGGELIGDILVEASHVRGGVIEKSLTAALIDEIPVLAVLGAMSESGLTVRDAAELRIKETDRIATVAENLQRMGGVIEVASDGFHVPGGQTLRGAEIDSFGDHRIAMAFAVAGLAAKGETVIQGADAAAVSFPEFFSLLKGLAG